MRGVKTTRSASLENCWKMRWKSGDRRESVHILIVDRILVQSDDLQEGKCPVVDIWGEQRQVDWGAKDICNRMKFLFPTIGR